MNAMVLREYNNSLVMEKVSDPCPLPDEVVVKVHGAGMCYTDIKIVAGQLSKFIKLPHIPGHEIAGEIVETGKNVKNLKPGHKGVVYSIIGCGDCLYCRSGKENLCINTRRIGFEENGGFAEYVKLPAYNFCPFNSSMPFEKMAILPDAVGTPYHAFKEIANPGSAQSVLIVGAGGLGIHAVQLAKHKGSYVIVCDIKNDALELAKKYGADVCFNLKNENDIVSAVYNATAGLGADIVLEGVGKEITFSWSLRCLKKGGTLIVMGYDPVNKVPVPFIDMHNNEWKIAGTKITTKQDLLEVIDLVDNGIIDPVVTRVINLGEINSGLDLVRNHEIPGRVCVKIE